MSDDNIVRFPGADAQEFPTPRQENICLASEVIQGASELDLHQVVVVGLDKDGKFVLFANARQMADALMLLKRAEYVMVQTEHI